jgi:hypothetical protein
MLLGILLKENVDREHTSCRRVAILRPLHDKHDDLPGVGFGEYACRCNGNAFLAMNDDGDRVDVKEQQWIAMEQQDMEQQSIAPPEQLDIQRIDAPEQQDILPGHGEDGEDALEPFGEFEGHEMAVAYMRAESALMDCNGGCVKFLSSLSRDHSPIEFLHASEQDMHDTTNRKMGNMKKLLSANVVLHPDLDMEVKMTPGLLILTDQTKAPVIVYSVWHPIFENHCLPLKYESPVTSIEKQCRPCLSTYSILRPPIVRLLTDTCSLCT